MYPYGPYRSERKYRLAAAMRAHGIEPSIEAMVLGRTVAHLQD